MGHDEDFWNVDVNASYPEEEDIVCKVWKILKARMFSPIIYAPLILYERAPPKQKASYLLQEYDQLSNDAQ